jgi:hypothetical protein
MNRVPATRTTYEAVKSDRREFDLVDAKGRRFGYRVSIIREFFTAHDPVNNGSGYWLVEENLIGRESFLVCPHSMRGGQDYGAIPVRAERRVMSLADATIVAEQMFANARKAAEKKAAR